ncbi:MAG: PSP1 C-terminal domain-containing protein [Pirellulaceae bacterium]
MVCRTERGLEVGEVLVSACEPGQVHGTLLRRVSISDELLIERLERHKRTALQACQQQLDQRGLPVVLIDVEHLLDGALYFYFLGDERPELEQLTAELSETYDAAVQFRRFAATLTDGCGPNCGTEQAAGQGCGTGGCATCAVARACGGAHPT